MLTPRVPTAKRDEQTYAILGAAMTVHRELGHGFLESVYHQALACEFKSAGIPFERERPLRITYRGQLLEATYRVDFLCYGEVLVEIKALAILSPTDEAQLINYLKASRLHRGLLVDFGASTLQYKRVVFGEPINLRQ